MWTGKGLVGCSMDGLMRVVWIDGGRFFYMFL